MHYCDIFASGGQGEGVLRMALCAKRIPGPVKHPEKLDCSEYKGYKYAIQWLGKAENLSPAAFDMKTERYNALLLRADFVALFCINAGENEAVFQLLEQALSDCQQAMKVFPDKTSPCKVAGRIHEIKAEFRLKQLHSYTGLSNDKFAAQLMQVESVLENALQFEPENQSLQDMLGNIRGTLLELK